MASYYPKQEATKCKLRQQHRANPLRETQANVIIVANRFNNRETTISKTNGGITDTLDKPASANQLAVSEDAELNGSQANDPIKYV